MRLTCSILHTSLEIYQTFTGKRRTKSFKNANLCNGLHFTREWTIKNCFMYEIAYAKDEGNRKSHEGDWRMTRISVAPSGIAIPVASAHVTL